MTWTVGGVIFLDSPIPGHVVASPSVLSIVVQLLSGVGDKVVP